MPRPPPDETVAALVSSPEVRRHLMQPGTGVYIVDHDGDILWASPSMQEVTGRSPQWLAGRNGWDVFVPPEDLAQVAGFKAALADGDGVVWMRVCMPDGAREWFRIDAWVREDCILCAFRREGDPAERRFHYLLRPRR